MNAVASRPQDISAGKISLEKARFDPQSTQAQMIAGFFAILVACFAFNWMAITSGFDALDMATLSDPLAGHWQKLVDGITHSGHELAPGFSFSPVSALLIMGECFLFRQSAQPYHAINILLLFWSAAAASLVALEITGRFGNRLGACPAIWAGLLTIANPWNRYLMSFIAGQQWLLANALTMTAVFALLRFRQIRELPYYYAALASSVLALLANDLNSFIVPCVLLASWLIPTSAGKSATSNRNEFAFAAKLIAPVFLAAAMYLGARHLWVEQLWPSAATVLQIFTKQLPTSLSRVMTLSIGGVGAIELREAAKWSMSLMTLSVLARLVFTRLSWRAILFLVCWLAVAALSPQHATWSVCITPMAAMCVALPLAALPAMDRLDRRVALGLTVVGAGVLLIVFVYWSSISLRFLG